MRKSELEKENKQLKNLNKILTVDLSKMEVERDQIEQKYESLEKDYNKLSGSVGSLKHEINMRERINKDYRESRFYRLYIFFNGNKWR